MERTKKIIEHIPVYTAKEVALMLQTVDKKLYIKKVIVFRSVIKMEKFAGQYPLQLFTT